MGQINSLFLKRLVNKSKTTNKLGSIEQTKRCKTIEKLLRKQGFLKEGETLQFVDKNPIDERNKAINEECHKKEYISHLENVIIR